ncbi:multidrug efflux SMR transporter [Hahella aquimaris]|uniref:DMT family transporter n=1 Tax=Hahella sp. HNIBRBA332 TaxID=3015983 RepID=UPI00273B8D58|nr:multidrug efflux SMR transporter [Hahella sp. HNIBRBA332]WLQ13065.1 multidrug efflux SMR transporter [Hahella sp. HNIBRBA332]
MKPIWSTYAALAAAILLEVIGTTFLQKSEQFSKLTPTILMALCYLGAFYFLSYSLKTIPVGLAYAIWSGLGIVLISAIGYLLFRQTLDLPAMIGLGFIIIGVIIVNVFSNSINH